MAIGGLKKQRVARLEKVLNQLVNLVEGQVDRTIQSLKLPERKEIVYLQERLNQLEGRLSQYPAAKRAITKGREVATKVKARYDESRQSLRKSEKPDGETCRIQGCSKPIKARGLCGTHYQAARRKGQFAA
ncbi:MAG: hypothetical protein PHE84_02650 [bacterium]|nr:hypothetical protein [bacterium]